MASSIIIPLSLIARSILAVLCNLEAAIEAILLKNGGRISLNKILQTPHTPKLEKMAGKKIWVLKLLSWSLKMHAFSMNNSQSWAN